MNNRLDKQHKNEEQSEEGFAPVKRENEFMEEIIAQEMEAMPTEEMSAQQAADFEAEFDCDTQAADAKDQKQADREDKADISGEDIERASLSDGEETPESGEAGIRVKLGEKEYTFSQEEIENYKKEPSAEQKTLEKLAKQAGISTEELIWQAERSEGEAKCAMRAEQLYDQGYDYDMALHIAQIEIENASLRNQAQPEGMSRDQILIFSGIEEFERMYPDVDDLPETVVEEIRAGATPVAAYQSYLLEEKERELAGFRYEQMNREKLPGSVKGMGTEVEDPFITELMK